MLEQLASLAPKEMLAGGFVLFVLHYAAIAPELAIRVVRADHMETCRAEFQKQVAVDTKDRLGEVSVPSDETANNLAVGQLSRLQTDPLFQSLLEMSGELGGVLGIDRTVQFAHQRAEQARRASQEAYEKDLARVRRDAQSRLQSAGEICGCIASAAIAKTRIDWAIFSGSFGLVRTDAIADFGQQMAMAGRKGVCPRSAEAGQ